jgi:hypothetical protein
MRLSNANTKLSPKYRGPGGETWAGRGLRSKRLQSWIKGGHKVDEFALVQSASSPIKRTVKKSRKKLKRNRKMPPNFRWSMSPGRRCPLND